MSSKRVRPDLPVPDASSAGGGGDESVLRRCILGFYNAAIERLPVEEKPALLPAILDGGVCFGPLDPVSNIVANTIRHLGTGEDSSAHVGEVEMRRGLKTMAWGSLKALVGFMTSYFRYLPAMEALHFLRAAEGDLLAAVHLVEAERCTCAFDIGSCTAKTALRCAAGVSCHRDPDGLATAMLSLSSKAHKIAHLLSRTGRLTCSAVDHLRYLLLEEETNDQICTQRLMVLVPPRLPPELADVAAAFSPLAPLGVTVKDERTLGRCTKALQSVLVDKIHGFYLEALALLPQHLLRGRYHRSVVMAGHCYGPLDPVSNIVLNTIWYDAAFPVPKKLHLDLDMVGRWALVRAERRSIAGLVAGLSAFAGDYNLSELEAIRCLLYANGDFATAMSVLQQALLRDQERRMLSDSELCRFMDVMAKRLQLYSVMAIAAQHPSPDGLQEFLISERTRAMLPRESRRFTREDVRSVVKSLLHEPPPSLGMPSELVRLSLAAERTIDMFPDATKRFWADMSSFHSKAKAALESYVLENGGPQYVIHVICGANQSIADRDGPEISSINWPRSHNKFHYSHINFLASPTGSCAAGVLPTLFFAECVNHDEESDRARKNTCCPVVVPPTNAEKVRCFYCEQKGINIIHPADGNYHGCDTDFENLARRRHILTNSIDGIFNNGLLISDFRGAVQEDFFYFDHARDHARGYIRMMINYDACATE